MAACAVDSTQPLQPAMRLSWGCLPLGRPFPATWVFQRTWHVSQLKEPVQGLGGRSAWRASRPGPIPSRSPVQDEM